MFAVLLTSRGLIKLADFGLATILRGDADKAQSLVGVSDRLQVGGSEMR